MENEKRKIQTKTAFYFPFSIFHFPFFSPFFILLVLFLLSANLFAQNLPDKIRGYKVYKANISVKNQNDKNPQIKQTESSDESEAFVHIGEPQLVDVSLSGITLELSAEIDALAQSGTIDFLMFKDFRVNNLAVEVEEYRESFKIKKNEAVILPKPVSIFISTGQTLRGALDEWRESKEEWMVTGTVFVFGHFKKSFMKFKRVVPVEINLKIKNPMKELIESAAKEKNSDANSKN